MVHFTDGCPETGLQWKAECGSVVQLLSHVQLFVTPRTAAHQASLSPTISWSLLKLTSIELVMPSHHLILCLPGFMYSLEWLYQVLVVTLGISGLCCSLWGL